jgi:hypothetical protein
MSSFFLMTAVLILALAAGIALARHAAERRWHAAGTAELLVGPSGVRRELADGRVEEVHWHEVTEVDVVLADRGPHRASGGVVVLFASETRGALVPLDQLASSGLVEHLTRLPGFRVEHLTRALEQRPPARTTCWRAG